MGRRPSAAGEYRSCCAVVVQVLCAVILQYCSGAVKNILLAYIRIICVCNRFLDGTNYLTGSWS